MSFVFNIGNESSDEGDDIDLEAYDDTGLLALQARRAAAASLSSCQTKEQTLTAPVSDNADHDNYEDSSDVDWEDADLGDGATFNLSDTHNDQLYQSKFPSQGVTVNLFGPIESNNLIQNTELVSESNQNGDISPSRKRKCTTRVLRDVPFETQQLILSVRRSHMLCILAHSMKCSSLCGGGNAINAPESVGINDEDECIHLLTHMANSLIPLHFHPEILSRNSDTNPPSFTSKSSIPTTSQIRKFSQWFFQLVNHSGERLREVIRRNVSQGASVAAAPSAFSENLCEITRVRRDATKTNRSKSNLSLPTQKRRRKSPNDKAARKKAISSERIPSIVHPQSIQKKSDFTLSANTLLQKLSFLSSRYDDDPQIFLIEEGVDVVSALESLKPIEKSLFFLAMVRSLGWRARLVTAIDPLPLQLTVDHPIFKLTSTPLIIPSSSHFIPNLSTKLKAMSQCTSLLQNMIQLMKESGHLKEQCNHKKMKTNARGMIGTGRPINSSLPGKQSDQNNTENHLGFLTWVEILCKNDKCDNHNEVATQTKPSPSSQPQDAPTWIPIYPEGEIVDKPEDIEGIITQIYNENNGNTSFTANQKYKRKRKSQSFPPKSLKRMLVSYVVAVEHFPPVSSELFGSSCQKMCRIRFSDVTPRYANSWSQTLRLRGATTKDITTGGGKCVDEWWESSMKAINQKFNHHPESTIYMQNEDRILKHCRKMEKKELPAQSTHQNGMINIKIDRAGEENIGPVKFRYNSDSSDEDAHDYIEARALTVSVAKEAIPTSKNGFKQSSVYVIPSVLNLQDVLHPDSNKRICGVFKGELIYRRSDVSKALIAKKWLYKGRRVMETELHNPVKRLPARKKAATKEFKALPSYVPKSEQEATLPLSYTERAEEEDEMLCLYGIWQTTSWSPPTVGSGDPIPTNDFKNIELALINPGLTHLEEPRVSSIARNLGIPYAPCMVGYEGHRGNRIPTIRGIVVHNHNVDLLREAYAQWESHLVEVEIEGRKKEILKRWKRLVIGLTTKDRLDREYC